ncbi:unnamed protein product [Parnassius apollo]|uniref:(apollo) hypothetical protein n=1 Tax=Parnassius apollo TaxID=110799 RepID=A0A8S3X080_PARAO|nr:unnamed protein product [Parnassius apollo]
MENIRLIPGEMIKIIPTFDGDKRHLNLFLRMCEYVIAKFTGTTEQNLYVMNTITSRLIGNAAALVGERDDIETWDEFKQLLIQHFGDSRSEECLNIELETLRIKPGESYLDFCCRIQSLRSILIGKVNRLSDSNMRCSKKAIYENTSLNVFLYNLPEHLVRVVRLKAPNSLEDALSTVLEEVNFHSQYQMRNKMSGSNLASHSQSHNASSSFKFGNNNTQPQHFSSFKPMQMNQPPRYNFGIPPNKQVQMPLPTQGQQRQFNNFGNYYRPPQPNNNQMQFGYRPPQFGYRPVGLQPLPSMRPQQFGMQQRYNNNSNAPQHNQPRINTDVSMRTAPVARPQQGFRVNELELNENDYNDDMYYYENPHYFDQYPNDASYCYPEWQSEETVSAETETNAADTNDIKTTENIENFHIYASTKPPKP